jgi:hypothetical protein
MSTGIFALGCVMLLVGAAYLAYLMQLPQGYVLGLGVVLAGLLVGARAQASRARDHRTWR